jgi:hypothetical protein
MGRLDRLLCKSQTAFVLHTALLLGLVAGATYAGTSNLFAAYIAGAVISWWDSELPHPVIDRTTPKVPANKKEKTAAPPGTSGVISNKQHAPSEVQDTQATPSTKTEEQSDNVTSNGQDMSGSAIYHRYYHSAVSKILQPLFFASIGFSIPITRMFRGAIVWRGIVYTILMALGKFVCGLWLVRFSSSPGNGKFSRMLAKFKLVSVPHLWGRSGSPSKSTQTSPDNSTGMSSTNASNRDANSTPNPAKPFSLHPPLILALAMCARGEIGFLISGVAESKGIFSSPTDASSDSSDIFLVVTWAIVICTIIGPLGVGLLVRRVRALQERKEKQQEGAGKDVLGVWGVE